MKKEDIHTAALTLWENWCKSTQIGELPADCQPDNRADAYAIQAELAEISGQAVAGWKIAATSLVGQAHIGVDGPLAGRLLAQKVLASGSGISLSGNHMRVGEAEFAFRFGRALPRRDHPYTVEEVLAAVESLHPAIEVPDSRYHDFARVGAPQLIADNACACWFVLGAPAQVDWRGLYLAGHSLAVYVNEKLAADGVGSNALGDPRIALTWLVNELNEFGEGLMAGDIVTTGTCITPPPISPGDRFRADFGALGVVEAFFT